MLSFWNKTLFGCTCLQQRCWIESNPMSDASKSISYVIISFWIENSVLALCWIINREIHLSNACADFKSKSACRSILENASNSQSLSLWSLQIRNYFEWISLHVLNYSSSVVSRSSTNLESTLLHDCSHHWRTRSASSSGDHPTRASLLSTAAQFLISWLLVMPDFAQENERASRRIRFILDGVGDFYDSFLQL